MPVATKGVEKPIATLSFGGATVIDSKVLAGVTINVADPDLLTSIVDVAVIVTVPADTPLATPTGTVATRMLLELQPTEALGIAALVPSE